MNVFHSKQQPILGSAPGVNNLVFTSNTFCIQSPARHRINSTHIYFPASGQAVVTGVVSSPPRFLPSIFIAHRVQQSHCSSIFHRVLPTHALALSASQFVRKKKSPRIYTSTHSGGFELTKLTYTRLEDNLIRHRGDRLVITTSSAKPVLPNTCQGRTSNTPIKEFYETCVACRIVHPHTVS